MTPRRAARPHADARTLPQRHRRAHTATRPHPVYIFRTPPASSDRRIAIPASRSCPASAQKPSPCNGASNIISSATSVRLANAARTMDSRRRATAAPAAVRAVAVATLVVTMMSSGVGGDFAVDRAECSEQLAGLATCLTYVQEQATASAPTPDCCAGLKAVLQSSRKCLCVLVKDRDDPNLGLKLNVAKALGLPAVCHAPANISDCPRLLNLPSGSKDAQVFEQYAKQAAQGGAPTSGRSSAAASATAGAQKSGASAAAPAGRWVGVVRVGGGGGARAVALAALLAVPFLLLLG